MEGKLLILAVLLLGLLARRQVLADYIWHRDELAYDPAAKCARGVSYYSNNINADDTDIDVPSGVESLLDYPSRDVCFYCVCSVNGNGAGCIHRDPWYCEYYRYLKNTTSARDQYTALFKQDIPSYFRSISYRLRRTMENGIYTLLENGGDALCCDHPSGHRRILYNRVRSKIWETLRKKVPKENIMSGSPGGDYVDFIVNNDK